VTAGYHVAHMAPSFLPWHRKLLWLFEYALCNVTAGEVTALPYWDFVDPASSSAIFNDQFMGACGTKENDYAITTGPFRQEIWQLNIRPRPDSSFELFPWKFLVRGCGADEAVNSTIYLPTAVDVYKTLNVDTYDTPPYDETSKNSFRNTLEGNQVDAPSQTMHNIVHSWVAGVFFSNNTGEYLKQGGVLTEPSNIRTGTTGVLDISPSDPMFYLLHANVDRLWWVWQHNGHEGPDFYAPHTDGKPGWNIDDLMFPYNLTAFAAIPQFSPNTPRSMLDSAVIGVNYQ